MKKLSFVAIAALLVIASCTKKAVPTAAAPNQPAINAAPLYAQNCSRCHGATGVEGRAPNLTTLNYNQTEIADIISNGKGHMPGFADKLSAAQIDAVAAFVSHLKK